MIVTGEHRSTLIKTCPNITSSSTNPMRRQFRDWVCVSVARHRHKVVQCTLKAFWNQSPYSADYAFSAIRFETTEKFKELLPEDNSRVLKSSLHAHKYVVASKVPGITLFLINNKQYNRFSYFPPKHIPCATARFCKRLSVCWKLSWKPICESVFQLFRRILNNVSSITNTQSLSCRFHWSEQVKIGGSQIRKVWGMLQRRHIFLC